jgi:hypothetical protein
MDRKAASGQVLIELMLGLLFIMSIFMLAYALSSQSLAGSQSFRFGPSSPKTLSRKFGRNSNHEVSH